jgi:hypothetical protein
MVWKKSFLILIALLIATNCYAASKTFIDGGVDHNWSTAGNWSPVASVPASGDDVILNASSPNCVVNANTNNLNSFDMTGYAGTLSGSSYIGVYGSAGNTTVCKFAGTVTWTGSLYLNPVSTATINLTNGGTTTVNGFTINGAGIVNVLDAISLGATKSIVLTLGTLHIDGASDNLGLIHNIGSLIYSTGSCNLYLGNSTCNMNRTNGSPWSVASGLTLYAGNSTINYTAGGVSTKNFSGGGLVYNNFSITGGGTGIINFLDGNTFNVFTINAPKTVSFKEGLTQTFTSFIATGTSSNKITILSETNGQQHTLSQSSGTVSCDWLILRDSAATGGASWYAGANSTQPNDNNSGWVFTAPQRAGCMQGRMQGSLQGCIR